MTTMRDFYAAIMNNSTITDEIRDYARYQIARLDREAKIQNQKEKSVAEIVLACFSPGEVKLAVDIAEETELTRAKVTAICRYLCTKGCLSMVEVKVRHKGSMKGYYLKEGG